MANVADGDEPVPMNEGVRVPDAELVPQAAVDAPPGAIAHDLQADLPRAGQLPVQPAAHGQPAGLPLDDQAPEIAAGQPVPPDPALDAAAGSPRAPAAGAAQESHGITYDTVWCLIQPYLDHIFPIFIHGI